MPSNGYNAERLHDALGLEKTSANLLSLLFEARARHLWKSHKLRNDYNVLL